MNGVKTRRGAIVRGFAELLVVILGVVLGLAVDRWVAGIDDRAAIQAWSRQLDEAFTQDSVAMVSMVQEYEAKAARGLDLLRTIDDTASQIEDPTELVRTTELIGWWAPFNANRSTWDEIAATGQLSLFKDANLRRALTEYYSYLDQLSNLESQWVTVFQDYWERQQAVVPPLLRIEMLDEQYGMGKSRPVRQAEAREIVAAFRNDDALNGALGTAVGVYRYGALVLTEFFAKAAAARAALQTN